MYRAFNVTLWEPVLNPGQAPMNSHNLSISITALEESRPTRKDAGCRFLSEPIIINLYRIDSVLSALTFRLALEVCGEG